MKKVFSVFFVLVFAVISFGQNDDWIRIESNDGEFSIEVPSNYGYFYDKEGISSDTAEMSILNAYSEHTLISFESFKGQINAFDMNLLTSSGGEFLRGTQT